MRFYRCIQIYFRKKILIAKWIYFRASVDCLYPLNLLMWFRLFKAFMSYTPKIAPYAVVFHDYNQHWTFEYLFIHHLWEVSTFWWMCEWKLLEKLFSRVVVKRLFPHFWDIRFGFANYFKILPIRFYLVYQSLIFFRLKLILD